MNGPDRIKIEDMAMPAGAEDFRNVKGGHPLCRTNPNDSRILEVFPKVEIHGT